MWQAEKKKVHRPWFAFWVFSSGSLVSDFGFQGLNRDWAHLDALLVGEFRANRLQAHGLYFFFWGLLLFGKSSHISVSARF